MSTVLTSIFAFVLAIGILVAVHEYGHYLIARLIGVKVLRFSIGFGRPIWLRRWGTDQTEYCVSAVPLGGYVKLLDEREGNVDSVDLPRAFNRQPIPKRIAVLVAGPMMNFVFAVFAYWAMFVIGVPGAQPIIGDVTEASIAANAGLAEGDRIVQVGEQPVATWEGAILAILDSILADGDMPMQVVDRQDDRRTVWLDVQGKMTELTEPGKMFSGLGITPWAPPWFPLVTDVQAGSPAETAGLLPGDLILRLDGDPVHNGADWVRLVQSKPDQTVQLVVERGGAELQLTVALASKLSEGNPVGWIGTTTTVPPGVLDRYRADQRYSLGESFGVALKRTWTMSALTVRMIGRMITGEVSAKNISGPINIAQYAGYSASGGLASFLSFLAIVSISLGILNLLPIPMLDGGQIVYQVLEAFKGSPLSERAQLIGQQIGIVILVVLMSFAFYNDLARIFN
jgi:regulator of sigma E protease